jgi:hypothetical protein
MLVALLTCRARPNTWTTNNPDRTPSPPPSPPGPSASLSSFHNNSIYGISLQVDMQSCLRLLLMLRFPTGAYRTYCNRILKSSHETLSFYFCQFFSSEYMAPWEKYVETCHAKIKKTTSTISGIHL